MLYNIGKMKNKSAQHEIMGFIVIIIIVSIIGLIFLSLSIGRGEVGKKTSVEASDFLQSAMHYTTSCAVSFIPQYKNIQDLIKSCYKNEKCLNEKMACEVLEETFGEIVKESFQVSEAGKNKAYKLNIYYGGLGGGIPDEEILKIKEGEFKSCGSEAGASQPIFISNGNINVDLEFCYG